MSTGFRLFDDSRWRNKLEESLHKIGYSMANHEFQNTTVLDTVIRPLGNGPSFLLRLLLGPDEDWRWGELLDIAGVHEHATFDFDKTRRYSKSCFEMWIRQIADAVWVAANKHRNHL